jgi:hypothetical protein
LSKMRKTSGDKLDGGLNSSTEGIKHPEETSPERSSAKIPILG